MRKQVIILYSLLLACNVAIWLAAFALFHARPVQMGAALVAYGFGLRHALDADHIAAIDGATRKLIQQGKPAAATGLFFALGHSSVVLLLSLAIALWAASVRTRLDWLAAAGGVVGGAVSAVFLLILAAINLGVLRSLLRTNRDVQGGGAYREEELSALLAQRGLSGRIFRGLFRLVGRSWHMYPIGLLFALGFDTAGEIGLLGLSAASASGMAALPSMMIFPALFTAGMALVDTSDSVLMSGAYNWALLDPRRKLRYNIVVTALSALVALSIGTIEGLSLLNARFMLDLPGGDDAALLGFGILATFLTCWATSALMRWHRQKQRAAASVAVGL